MSTSRIQLGAFDLLERIGAGGMGVIYRARHRPTGSEVAVKVVRGEPDEVTVRRFEREIRAHAALLHPSIAQLLDYGMVDEHAAADSAGLLQSGSPFVAMELADLGTVRNVQMRSWEQAREVLRQMLNALAYAHARGVVHRDLKPANILAFAIEGGVDVKLTDFGIAHALASIQERPTASLGTIIGTPKYMAPEQLLGRWRDHGPWTDLYAVGCIAFELVCGHSAFERSDGGVRAALEQLTKAAKELTPQFSVPPSLQRWVSRALAIQPDDRFQRASEALAELDRLEDDRGSVSLSAAAPTAPDPMEDTIAMEDMATVDHSGVGLLEPPEELPSAPSEWGDAGSTKVPGGAGLGLFGLREPPLVGRERERDALWSAFLRCAHEQAFEVALLTGEAGIGKSRLARWLTTRSHEIGSAHVLSLGDFTRRVDGLEALLRTWKMSREQVYNHLLTTLPRLNDEESERDYDVKALTELLCPAAQSDGGPRFEFRSGAERVRVLSRLLGRLARQRPTVVWIDDLREAGPALDLLEHLVANPIERVLVVATLRADLIISGSRFADRLDELRAASAVHPTDVGVLDEPTSMALARQLVTLPDTEIRLLVERMGGNPLLGIQLLTDWVERGLLRATDGGAALDTPSIRDSPNDIHSVWLQRVGRVEQGAADPALLRTSLELAVTLGFEVDQRAWDQLSGDVDPTLWDTLLARGLAQTTERGWRFTHRVFVDTLRDKASADGRAEELHRRCALALAPLYAETPLSVAARLASHWLAAGRPENALDPLYKEVLRLGRDADHHAQRQVLLLRARLIDQLAVPEDDLLRVNNRLEMCVLDFRDSRDVADICTELYSLLELLERRTAPSLTSKALRLLASAADMSGEVAEASRLAALSVAAGRESGSQRVLAQALFRQARIEGNTGNRARLEAQAHELRALASTLDDPYLLVQILDAQGWAAMGAGEVEAARNFFTETLDLSIIEGFRQFEAESHNSLGEAARLAGDCRSAVEHYEAGIRTFDSMRRADEITTLKLNRSLAEIALGHFDSAARALDEVEPQLIEYGWMMLREVAMLGRLAISAGTRDWDEFERLWQRLRSVDFGTYKSEDNPWTAKLAVRYALEGGRPDLARDLERFIEQLNAEP